MTTGEAVYRLLYFGGWEIGNYNTEVDLQELMCLLEPDYRQVMEISIWKICVSNILILSSKKSSS